MSDTLEHQGPAHTRFDADGPRRAGPAIGYLLIGGLVALLVIASYRTGQLGRLGWIAVTIIAVLAGSAALFIGGNKLVAQATVSWGRFRGLTGVVIGAAAGGVLRGNQSVRAILAQEQDFLVRETGTTPIDDTGLIELLTDFADPELLTVGTGLLGHAEWPIVGGVVVGVAAWASGALTSRLARCSVGVVFGLGAALLIADRLQFRNRPDVSLNTILIAAIVGAAAGGLVGIATRRHHLERALLGAAVGATAGAWLTPEMLGTGSARAAQFAIAIPMLLLALRVAWPHARSASQLANFTRRASAVVFLAPALGFLAVNLIIPAIRTLYTSLLDRESEQFVGLDNFRELWNDPASIDASEWTNMFGSQLFWIGLVLVGAGFLVGVSVRWIRDRQVGFERTSGSIGSLFLGAFIFLFAVFTSIRGTFINNLWWVVTVVTASTVLGLTIAVLAERAGRLESTAKAFIFMPMAISMVGASIIWRFQYQARNVTKNQTGVLNALWIELGELSQSGTARVVVLLVLSLLLAGSLLTIARRARSRTSFAGFTAVSIALLWLIVELYQRSLGGFTTGPNGEIIAETVLFREHAPFNNVFLMVILIWIQTGFAMVIFSAAIKAVPGELLEAALIDGADTNQQFFQVVLPQIMPTVGVVVTTLIVTVTKVFDIVKVSTGGNFDTNVLANDFFTESFSFLNRGVGSAIAVLILLTVAPVMIFNVWQMQRGDSS